MSGSDAVPLLLVEDGPLALLSTKTALEDEGYRVVAARHGMSALLALDQPVRALITDIRLPGPFDGWQIAEKARERWPGIPVMYITGDRGEDWADKRVPGSVILEKPCTAGQLVRVLDQLM